MNELRQGRLRQGWGYHASQDLRLIQKKLGSGARLTEDEQVAWRNHSFVDGYKNGDLIISPNLPLIGMFCISEVVGDYDFDLSDTSHNNSGDEPDFGHSRKVKLITPNGIDKYDGVVDSKIAATIKTPSRMWNIDYLGDAVEKIIKDTDSLGKYSKSNPKDVVKKMRMDLIDIGKQTALKNAKEKGMQFFDTQFTAHDFELAMVDLLSQKFSHCEVVGVGGPNEQYHGTDILITVSSPFEELAKNPSTYIPVQVKFHSGVSHHGLEQLAKSISYWRKQGIVNRVVLINTAELSDDAKKQFNELGESEKVDCIWITRDMIVDWFVELAFDDMFSAA